MGDAGAHIHGAKVVLMIGARLLVLRRDHTPGIAFPGMLDLPGGGIEPEEDGRACALREVHEEVGLRLGRDDLRAERIVAGQAGPFATYLALMPGAAEADIRFGGEGEGWCLMAPDRFVRAPDAIGSLVAAVTGYLRAGLIPAA